MIYGAAALIFTYPLLLVADSHITYKPDGDQLFLLSLLEWERITLFTRPDQLFIGNFYFGSGGALFGSDLLLGLLPIYAPIAWITQNPVLAYSLTHIGAYVLNAAAMYMAVLALTGSRSGALTAGAVFAFGPLQLAYASHLQLLAAWWLPLVLLFGLRFRRKGHWVDFGLSTLMVWIQFATAVHLGVIAAFVYTAFVLAPTVRNTMVNREIRTCLPLIAAAVVVSIPFIPIVQGYLAFSDAWKADRDITEVQFWSVQLRDYLSPTGRLRWHDLLAERFPVPRGERRVFPGVIPPMMAILGVTAGLLRPNIEKRSLRTTTVVLLVLGISAVLFSLGPNWKRHEIVSDIDLPYRLLFENLPVFRAIRVVARFSLLAHFSIAVLAGIGVAAIAQRSPRRWLTTPLIGFVAVALILFESWPEPLPVFSIPANRHLETALREAGPGPTLFVPVTGNAEIPRLWMATRIGAGPLVNGYSGHIWQQYWYFRDATQGLMASELTGLAKGFQAYGLRTVVIDKQKLGERDRHVWETFAEGPWVEAVVRTDQHLLITLYNLTEPTLTQWSDLQSHVLLDRVPPSAGFVGTLLLHNPSSRPWIPVKDSHVRSMHVEWIRDTEDGALSFSTNVLPPPFLRPGQTHATEVHFFTPEKVGHYQVRVVADDALVLTQEIVVDSSPIEPFAGSADGMLAALELRSAAEFDAKVASLLPLHVDAMNIGRKSWMDEANIRLGWRWYRSNADGSETEIPAYEGRVPLLGHIYGEIPPGRGYAFAGQLRAPDEHGHYVVRVSMLSELLAWFDIDPIEVRVVVRS